MKSLEALEAAYQEQQVMLLDIQKGQRLFLGDTGMKAAGIEFVAYPFEEDEGIFIPTLSRSRVYGGMEQIHKVNLVLDHLRVVGDRHTHSITPVEIARIVRGVIMPSRNFDEEQAMDAANLLLGVDILRQQGYLSMIDDNLHRVIRPPELDPIQFTD